MLLNHTNLLFVELIHNLYEIEISNTKIKVSICKKLLFIRTRHFSEL